MKAASDKRTIVVAWTDEGAELVKAGRVDFGESHRFRSVIIPRAVVWLRRGTPADIQKAAAHMSDRANFSSFDGPRGHVYAYETSERDPIGRAKRDVMKEPVR